MTQLPHQTVLGTRVIELTNPGSDSVWVDGTTGAGGHSLLLLDHDSTLRMICVDRDESALEIARERLADHADRVTFVHGRFGDIPAVLAANGISKVDGIVLDLGVSSMQLDRSERGFSFMRSGPIDMRMDQSSGETAIELIRSTPTDELADLIRELGEERFSKRVASAIRHACREDELGDTLDLANVIAKAIPGKAKRQSRIHPATRTFQALRIAVNAELGELDSFLETFPDLLNPGGHCAVISFHSLEDRRVKHRFRDLAFSSSLPPNLAIEAGERVHPICTRVTRKAAIANEDEVAANPRARSARLRVCQKFVAQQSPN